jgi:hypothetical protein
VLFRAWFRYLRQTGLSYSLITVVDALRRAPNVARGLVALFDAQHDPAVEGSREEAVKAAETMINNGLAQVAAIDEDRILRLIRSVVAATLRTNAFAESGHEALAFKLDSSLVPGLPAPVPVAGDLGLFAAGRGHPPSRRPGRARRPSLVRPARRFPDRDPRPDEGAGGEECRHRPDRGQGRILSQAIAADERSGRLARGRHRILSDLHPGASFRDRQYRGRGDHPSGERHNPRR